MIGFAEALFFLFAAACLLLYFSVRRRLKKEREESDHKMVDMGKDFISNASHELRTPITIIRGFAETLHDLQEISPELLQEITGKIVRTSHRLEKLVTSLLTLADVEHPSMDHFQEIDLVPLLEHCRHFVLSSHPHVHLSFKTSTPSLLLIADPGLLDLAIMNLLENAVRYSDVTPHIEMHLEQTPTEALLHIKDQGIGIPPADKTHVFERFYTVDKARSRKMGGSGLGLAIVKTVVNKHRGRVSVQSELGKGSVFTLALPKII
jgi:two-component system phosphate regulon sensor histidine kinase PhoR